jgi:hypothetical protein
MIDLRVQTSVIRVRVVVLAGEGKSKEKIKKRVFQTNS